MVKWSYSPNDYQSLHEKRCRAGHGSVMPAMWEADGSQVQAQPEEPGANPSQSIKGGGRAHSVLIFLSSTPRAAEREGERAA